MKGFRDFILRGNVMDLAVAVVIGAAFTAVVTALVTYIINPLIGAAFKADNLKGTLVVTLPVSAPGATPAKLEFGSFIAAVINFVIVAAVVYFLIVLPVNALLKRAFRRAQAQPASAPVDTPPTEADLLLQIRDLLAAQNRGGAGGVTNEQVVDKT